MKSISDPQRSHTEDTRYKTFGIKLSKLEKMFEYGYYPVHSGLGLVRNSHDNYEVAAVAVASDWWVLIG